MYYYKLLLLSSFLLYFINANAQLKANAGTDIMVCYPNTADARTILGGNPVASGGVEPYKYTWSGRQIKYTSPDDSVWVYASKFLNDTTISNPSFKSMDVPEKWTNFYLKVEDAAGNLAYDTVRVIDAFITSGGNYMQPVTIQRGDSIHFFGNNHVFQSNFPLEYSITPTNGLKDPKDFNGWAKPDTTTTYYIHAVNAAGCETKTYYLKVNVKDTYHPFPSKNTLWTELVVGPEYEDYYGFDGFALKNNDTIINNKLYHKLYRSTDTLFTETKLCGGIREENKKIYFYAIDSIPYKGMFTYPSRKKEIILYDFSLKLGDSISSKENYHTGTDYAKVIKVDSILTDVGYRKRWTFGKAPLRPYTDAQWIEGIGSIKGLLFVLGDIPMNGPYNDLMCVRQENKWIFHSRKSQGDCFPRYTDVNEINNNDVSISPNPAEQTLRIKFPLGYVYLHVLNMYGAIIKDINIQGQTTAVVYRENLPAGLYFINLMDKNKKYKTVKVIFR